MSLFQCERCGCAENSAVAYGGTKLIADILNWDGMEDRRGMMLCSACAPAEYRHGGKSGLGVWHGTFSRVFLPMGMFVKNPQGNLAHRETGDINYHKYALIRADDGFDTEYSHSDIIASTRAKLKANEFEGLFWEGECACELSDLAPCGNATCGQNDDGDYINGCKPGYKHIDPRPERGGHWCIGSKKEPLTIKDWEQMVYE